MPLFGKKVSNEEWRAGATGVLDTVKETCDIFDITARAIAHDPVAGWRSVVEALASFAAYNERFKSAKSMYERVGKPQSPDPTIANAKQSLDTFFSLGDLAFYWGKLHYSDVSGGPGERARTETGIAQRAAQNRVTNNGKKYAENAMASAKAGRAALQLLSARPYKAAGPSLTSLFINTVDELRSSLGSEKQLKLSQVATAGSWCFSQAAILGMLVSREPEQFMSMVWDPKNIDKFWRSVDSELERIDSAGLVPDRSLGYIRMTTQYPELYGSDALTAAVFNRKLKEFERLANSSVPVTDARMRWSMDTAIGFGLGIRRPLFVRSCLEAQANPNHHSWALAQQAGLDIPPEPDAMSVNDQIEALLEVCRLFFGEYYPEAKRKLDALTQ